MYKKIINRPVIIILSIFCVCLLVLFIIRIYDSRVRLVIDSNNDISQLPRNFRMCSSTIKSADKTIPDLYGYKDLNISGSSQFSEKGLAAVQKVIGVRLHIIIIDLKQESHGFINGTAVSWVNGKNNLNKGLTKEEVLKDESERLNSIKANSKISIGNETLVATKVQSEKELVESMGMTYMRMPVNDKEKPADSTVDEFIRLVKTMPSNTWLHFHCEEGLGRTTTFMVMYDIMKNAKKVTLNDIMNRQILFGGKSLLENNISKETKQRAEFINEFYTYAKENDDNFNTTWSQWSETAHKFYEK